jgi:4-alpha-glucanotransferase
VDFLAASGQSLWQILPIGPTGIGDSPYQCFSAFAGNPYHIDLTFLYEEGLLTRRDLKALEIDVAGADSTRKPTDNITGNISPKTDPTRVDYDLQLKHRIPLLRKAARKLDLSSGSIENTYRAFLKNNAFWLDDFALFMAVKYRQSWAPLCAWLETLRAPTAEDFVTLRIKYEKEAELWKRMQFLFFEQWANLKRYANARGIGIVGDLPFYVSEDSSDYWANPELFEVGKGGRPSAVAGVPPDDFSEEGQIWNNPLYRWKAHRRTEYAWWMDRLRQANRIYDSCRIDHFRGFSEYFSVPRGQAAADGEWAPGPGKDFIDAIRKNIPGLGIIAEDLGILTDDVHELLKYSGYPGMKVMQFAFSPDEESSYLPHNHIQNCVVYTGTHDNNTLLGWIRESDPPVIAKAMNYLAVTAKKHLPRTMIRAAFSSVAEVVIVPMQDWLSLGAAARINTPSTIGQNNWKWRLANTQLTDALAAEILEISTLYGRARQSPEF